MYNYLPTICIQVVLSTRCVILKGRQVLFFFFFLWTSVQAQSNVTSTNFAEHGVFASSGNNTPFWLRANQWGQIPLLAPTATARLGISFQSNHYVKDTIRRKMPINWEVKTEAIANVGKTSGVLLPEAYAKLRWKQLELMVGRERQIIGLVDTVLSSGSYSWSGNAIPVPMVRVGLAKYLPFGFLKNFVSVKGSYAHGWLLNTYIKKAYLHQKTLYGRLGKPNSNVHLEFGFVHQVMWGGEADYLINNPVAVGGKLPSSISNYFYGVVLAQIPDEKSNSQITTFDGVNRIGNHLGHYDLAIDWRIKKTKFMLYKQHPFEDASGLAFQNLPDGLYGFSVRLPHGPFPFLALKAVTLEYLYTKNQTGDSFTIPGSRFSGGDNYLNHSQYLEGWSYKEHGLGTPFIPTKLEVNPQVAQNGQFFPSNRVILYHIGMKGILAQRINLTLKVSQSRHYTSSLTPFSNPIYRQFSSILSIDTPILRWGNTRLRTQIAYDRGDVFPESLGGYLGIRSEFRRK